MMRSPPPPQPSNSNYAGSPYAGPMGGGGGPQHAPTQGGGGQFPPNNFVGGFMNDQTAQIGFQVGQKAMTAGQEYMEQSVLSPSHDPYIPISSPSKTPT